MIAGGTMPFSIESRILRELGERLVKHPEVAVVELVKNAYDADATDCTIAYEPDTIVVADNGDGMTLDRFSNGWMRIGTSAKEETTFSQRFGRPITGEKGIGRFSVRFLGRRLRLDSTADDPSLGMRTHLTANFDWPDFDRKEDLGEVSVPYALYETTPDTPTGTTLRMTNLRPEANGLNFNTICTGAIGVLTPLRSLFREVTNVPAENLPVPAEDSGFSLHIPSNGQSPDDVASLILSAHVLRATVELKGNRLDLTVFRRGQQAPHLQIVDTYDNSIGHLHADIRFFPARKGTFTHMPVDGRRARSWISDNHGVAVYDRGFRIAPYGYPGDDWLELQADAARNTRDPKSSLARKHFQMEPSVRAAPSQNWMIRLPQSAQLVGLVEVEGHRVQHLSPNHEAGLIASADREGFIQNPAFSEMWDVVRGAVEAIAFADRQIQAELEQAEREQAITDIRSETQDAIAQVRANPRIAPADKRRVVDVLLRTEHLAVQHDQDTKSREQQLLVMSLLGVVAGFMTHEFGAALQELNDATKLLQDLDQSRYEAQISNLKRHSRRMREQIAYSTGFILGSRHTPPTPYTARPRLNHVMKTFREYARRRNIKVQIVAEDDLTAPLVPASLYDGVALNLYTNALKGVTAKVGAQSERISFRAWNEADWHLLEVSDTGVGIPSAMYERVFDPLFTTTAEGTDPLGSGMGLGLTFVRRSVEAFGGSADVRPPLPGFATTVRVSLPLASSATVPQ